MAWPMSVTGPGAVVNPDAAKAGGRDALTNLRVPRTKGTVGDSEAALEAGFLFGSPEFQRH